MPKHLFNIRHTYFVSLCISGAFLFAAIPGLTAQNPMTSHSMETRDEIPPEKLPPPIRLTGIGNAHIRVTASPEAQMWFDQGLNLLHDFWDYESDRAFEQAVRVDPNCAMCYWGIYKAEMFAHSNAKYYATQALNKAVSRKKHVSKAERLYIEAAAAADAEQSSSKPDDDSRNSKSVQIYRKLVKQNPSDLQARILLAEDLSDGYDDNDQPRPGEKEALAILQEVLKQDPNNSAANHYWIHAVEASPHPEQALHSAEILGSLAPASGHMVHMPGHIFYRLGDYTRAEAAFTASMKADESYMQTQHVPVDDDWNYAHNLMYAIANLMEAGKLQEATGLADRARVARGELENSLYPWSTRDAISRLDPRLPVALRAADWSAALRLLNDANPPATLPNLQFLARELTNFSLGMQALDQHDNAEAESVSAQLDAELWRVSERIKTEQKEKDKAKKNKTKSDSSPPKLTVMPDAIAKPLLSNLSIMSLELRAGLLLAKRQTADAKKLYAQAAAAEKDLGYWEPPAYIRPVGETEAAAFLSASDWLDAMDAFKRALIERPRSGFPLYGIALTSEKAGDVAAAEKEYSDFLSAWKSANSDLPQIEHANAFLAAHHVTSAKN
ncbi:MAG TPA: hypothetical protein VJN93_06980 [Candidatus Acidoferrum sp.]|nr:hypothetical protein [Candidatus Acidoferrum sp.]